MNTTVKDSQGPPTLAGLLEVLVENKGSDLHVQTGEVPIGRFNGELGRFEIPALTEADVLRLARDIGLGLVERMPALKRMFIREAAGFTGDVPKLLKGEAL